LVSDRVGREWQLSLSRPGDGGASTSFDGMLEGLVDAAFAPWGSGDRRLAQTLLAVHAALSGARVETDDGDDWQNVVREVRASLLRATRTGQLELCRLT